jgi:hypothetical protein
MLRAFARLSLLGIVTLPVLAGGCVNPRTATLEPRGFSTSYERYQRNTPSPPVAVSLDGSRSTPPR